MSVALHEEENLGKAYDTQMLLRLWQYVKPYWLQVLCTLGLVVPMFILEIGQPYLVKQGVDTFLAGQETIQKEPSGLDRTIEWMGLDSAIETVLVPRLGVPPLAWLACLYLLFAVGLGLMQYLHMLADVDDGAERDARSAAASLSTASRSSTLGFFDNYPVGRLVTRTTNDVENIAEMFSAGIVALITDLAKMVGFGVILWLEMPSLAWKSFLVVPVLTVAAAIFRWKVRDAFRDVRVRIARINAHIQENRDRNEGRAALHARRAQHARLRRHERQAPRRLAAFDSLRRAALRRRRSGESDDHRDHLVGGDRHRDARCSVLLHRT